MTTVPQNIETAYRICADITRRHYENFPVASILLPTNLRKPISAIYSFARTADDLADEGTMDTESRFSELDLYLKKFESMLAGEITDDPVFTALAHTISEHQLQPSLFTDLLDAFKQDITKKRYKDFAEVMDYCRRSANPVGRLLIQLVNKDTPTNQQLSDSVCTALQLINFYQDIGQDYDENNRIYLAEDEMLKAGIDENHLAQRITDTDFRAFMTKQIDRADNMLISGYPLCRQIGGRLGMELRATIHGAHMIANKMRYNHDLFTRPRLTKTDWPIILFKSILDIKPARRY